MASCRQIETMLQARIDDELGHAERVILEQHLAECAMCTALLRKHQRSAALLFEGFAEHQLKKDMRESVIEHLPEMEPTRSNARRTAAQRAPTWRRSRAARVLPPMAAGLVVVLAGVLYLAWPRALGRDAPVIGVVTHRLGEVKNSVEGRLGVELAAVKDFIHCGQRYVTGPDAKLMLTLRGPTYIKVNENTRVKLADERAVVLETGHIWLDVAQEGRQFTVDTPAGEITVLGTTFEVFVDGDTTTVTLKNGSVRVENDVAACDMVPGEQVEIAMGQQALEPRKVAVAEVMAWANAIVADQEASGLFAAAVQQPTLDQLRAQQCFVFQNSRAKSVSAFTLTWAAEAQASPHCGYDIIVCNEDMVELFRDHIDGEVFARPGQDSCVVRVPGEPISNVKMIHVKLAPDHSDETTETTLELAITAQ